MSTGTIIDLVSEFETKKFEKKEKPSIGRQIGLGITQGTGDLSNLVGMVLGGIQAPLTYGILDNEARKAVTTPGMEAEAESIYKKDLSPSDFVTLAGEDSDIVGPLMLPGQRAALTAATQRIPEEGNIQEITRRGVRSLPALIGGPLVAAEVAGRELLGLGGKKIAEKLGLGEIGQSIFDLGFSLAPNPKKFIESGPKIIKAAETGTFTTQKELVDYARKIGMSEQEIAPLVRDGWFSNMLTKISPKRGATEKALHETKAAVGRNFQNLRAHPSAQQALSSLEKANFLKNVEGKLYDLPAGARNAISEDLQQLMSGEMTGDRLMKFWGDINSYFRDHPKLGNLKDPIKKALSSLSPELATDFNLTNTLSQRYRDIASRLKPNIGSDIVGASEAISLIGSLIHGNAPVLAATVGTIGARKVAQMMLTNPRFQNLTRKMVSTLNAGQANAAYKILDQMTGLIQKESPEMASELQKISISDLEELLKK